MKNISMTGNSHDVPSEKEGGKGIINGYNQRKLKQALLLDKILNWIIPQRNYGPIPSEFQKILVIQSHLVGDIIMAIPLLRALRLRYPKAEIILVANEFAQDIFAGADLVNDIVTVNFPWSTYDYSLKNIRDFWKKMCKLRGRGIDLAIDAQIDVRNAFAMFMIGAKRSLGYALTGGGRFLTDAPPYPANVSNLLEARLSLLNYLHINCADKSTSLPILPANVAFAESFLKISNLSKDKFVCIHPGASKREKLWSALNFAEVINYLYSKGYQPVIIEGPLDGDIVNAIQKAVVYTIPCFKGTIAQVMALISLARLLICLDSSAIHFAGAVGTPALAIYGPQPPSLTKPFASNIEVVWNDSLNCRPCEYGVCKHGVNNKCMESIKPKQVIEEINKIIARNQSA
jgi:lipopolysaccharide heptosyltransferase II